MLILENRVYVGVDVNFDVYGRMIPLNIKWEDGAVYHIDKVTDVRQAYASKSGGQGDRYTVVINGRSKYLYFERSAAINGDIVGCWFVERHVS